MKKITIILLILISPLISCRVQKINKQQKTEILIDSLNYTVLLPENWKPILDSHDLLSYSPKNLGDIFYKNIIRIYNSKMTKNKNTSLSEFVQENIKRLNNAIKVDSNNLTRENTKYGDTYTYNYENTWNFTHYINTIKYFRYNDDFYKFSYSSDKRFYEKYLTDTNFIFINLKFKKKEKALKKKSTKPNTVYN